MAAGAFPVGSIAGLISISGATEAQRDILGVQRSMTLTGESATRTAAGLDSTAGALGTVGRASSSAATGSAKLRAAQLSAVAATERYTAVLADEDASLGRLASAEAAVIRANERVKASTPVAAMTETAAATDATVVGMSRASGAVSGFARTAAGLGLMFGGFELLKKALDVGKQASQFQREMLLVQTQAGASAAEVRGFSGAVLGMAGDVATAPDKLANSLYHAYSVGLRGAQALQAVEVAAEGAKVGNADLEQTTNALTAAVASGIPGVQNMTQAMGALNTIVGAGDMNLEQLNEALGSGILVVAKQFGVTLTDVGAALATFGDNNIRGAQAATTLRVSINAMAKLVVGGAAELAKFGLTSRKLAADMQQGGLSQALHDLKDHLSAAGITGSKVGDVLLTAFGKKAGPGISVLVDQLARFDQKTAAIEKGAGSFGDRWKATTQTASFAFQKLGAEVEAGGIAFASKLVPAVTSAAAWLGTSLPHDISVLASVLSPTVHMVGVGLVGAWHGFLDVAAPVAAALGSVAHFLAENRAVTGPVITGVLAMWAAWKGYQIVTSAVGAIRGALLTLQADMGAWGSAMRAGMGGTAAESRLVAVQMEADMAAIGAATLEQEAVSAEAWAAQVAASDDATANMVANAQAQALAAQGAADAQVAAAAEAALAAEEAAASIDAAGVEAGVGWSAALGPLALVGIGVGALTMAFGGNSAAAAQNAAEIDSLTQAIESDNGALGENTRQTVINALQKAGALKAARELGLSLSDVTDAALGNAGAYADVTAATSRYLGPAIGATKTTRAQFLAATDLIAALTGQTGAVKDAVQGAKDEAAANKTSAASTSKVATATQQSADAHTSLAQAMNLVVGTDGNLVFSSADVVTAAKAATTALQEQTVASQNLKLAEDLLNGVNETYETSTDNLSIALGNLRTGEALAGDATTKHSRSLDQNTVLGAQNRQMLVQLIDAAKAQAQAVADEAAKHMTLTDALKVGNTALGKNETAIRAAAKAAGLNKQEVDHLIGSLGILSKVKAVPKIDANTAPAQTKADQIQARIDAIKQNKIPGITANTYAGQIELRALQSQIDNMRGRVIDIAINYQLESTYNSQVPKFGPSPVKKAAGGFVYGPGTGTSDTAGTFDLSNHEFVVRAAQAKKYAGLLTAINSGAPAAMVNRSAGDYYASQPAGPVNQRDGSQAMLAELGAERRALLAVAANLTAAVAAYTGQPVSVAINDREVARSVERSGLVESYLDEAARLLQHGRAAHR